MDSRSEAGGPIQPVGELSASTGMKLSGIVRGVIGGALLTLAVVGALIVPSLIVRPGADFSEVPVAVPPEYGLSVVRAAPTASPPDRQTPSPDRAPRREQRRGVPAGQPRSVVAAAPNAPPVSRPSTRPAPTRTPPASAPTAPVPAPQPERAPTPPEREILVAEQEPAAPPQGKPVVDECPAPEPAKNEGEKKGHEKNEPQRNGHDRDEDQQGGPKQDRDARD